MVQKIFTLEGNKIVMTYSTKDGDVITKEYPLHRISTKDLHEIRRLYCTHELKCTYAIIKDETGIRIAKIPQKAGFHGISDSDHICGSCIHSCSDCAKIFDRFAEYADKNEFGITYIQDIKRLEKYPFIKRGVEAFNSEMGKQFMIIEKCSHYDSFEKRKKTKLTPIEKNEKLDSLYQYLFTD